MSINLIGTQELGKARKPKQSKPYPTTIAGIVARMHELRAEKKAMAELERKKKERKNFDALALLDEVQ